MRWYAAHVVLQVVTVPRRKSVSVWENVHLIRAANRASARRLAIALGRRSSVSKFEWDGLPASWKLLGVRKIVECDDPEHRPSHGTEITYSQYQFASAASLKSFLEGEVVNLICEV